MCFCKGRTKLLTAGLKNLNSPPRKPQDPHHIQPSGTLSSWEQLCHAGSRGLGAARSPNSPSCHRRPCRRPCSPGKDTCKWSAAPPCEAEAASASGAAQARGHPTAPSPASPFTLDFFFPAWLRPRLFPYFGLFCLLCFFAVALLARNPPRKNKDSGLIRDPGFILPPHSSRSVTAQLNVWPLLLLRVRLEGVI